jgi:hypothetical protein
MVRCPTTQEFRDAARLAFVRVTGMSYDYRRTWTDKTSMECFRRVGIALPSDPRKSADIVNQLYLILNSRGFYTDVRQTESGYVRAECLI